MAREVRDAFIDDVRNVAVREVDGVQLLVALDSTPGNGSRASRGKHWERGRSHATLTRREVERLHDALGEWLGARA